MNNLICEEALHNILGHIRKCWDYTYPTGSALEEAIYRGLKPFYNKVESLGSPKTLTDIRKDKDAFDVKGAKKLGHIRKIQSNSNSEENNFVEQQLPNRKKITVRIAKSVYTQVRRPKVDLKNYKGDALKILQEQINEYHQFALKTTTKDGCENIISIVCQYGEDKGFRSVYLSVEPFKNIQIVSADIAYQQKSGKPNGYRGFDNKGNEVVSLSSFNRGSANMCKKFRTDTGILYTWAKEDSQEVIYTKHDLSNIGAVKIIDK